MQRIISRTFGGLKASYYVRQFIFALLPIGFFYYILLSLDKPIPMSVHAMLIPNVFLYPYARYFFSSILGFFAGDGTYTLSMYLVLFWKVLAWMLCLTFAVILGPCGLIVLYFKNR